MTASSFNVATGRIGSGYAGNALNGRVGLANVSPTATEPLPQYGEARATVRWFEQRKGVALLTRIATYVVYRLMTPI